MKFLRLINLMVIMVFLSACGANGIAVPGVSTDTRLPPPAVTVISAPDPTSVLASYLEAYKTDDCNTMYSLVSKVTRRTRSRSKILPNATATR